MRKAKPIIFGNPWWKTKMRRVVREQNKLSDAELFRGEYCNWLKPWWRSRVGE